MKRSALALAVVALVPLVPVVSKALDDGEPTRPNVVVLMTDDQTVESLRVMPEVNSLLAAEGATFENSFVNFSLCCPSRATFLTGQYAHNHGVEGNQPPAGGYTKLDGRETLPVWLQRAGYRTMHLGKYLNGYGRFNGNPTEIPPGWDDWNGSVDPSTYSYYDYTLNENGTLRTYGADRDPAFYQTDFYGRRASELIEEAAPADEPFFLSVAFLAPHSGKPETADNPPSPHTPEPAPRHRDRFASEPLPMTPAYDEADVSDKPEAIQALPPIGSEEEAAIREAYQQRLESLLAVDEAVAGIVGSLRRTGELDNTLIVFTSDNGFQHGEHRVQSGKVLVYEPSIRVPLLIRGPGLPAGAHQGGMVVNADVTATILDAAGAEAGRAQDGRSLIPLLRNPDQPWERDLLIEAGKGQVRGNQGRDFFAVRTDRYVYVEYGSGERELYDLQVDPFQLESRHADPRYAAVADALARRLGELSHCAGRNCSDPPTQAIPEPGP